ncbi:type 2 periplasmic-binding domain-containing protein [Bradyrhizobium sp. 5.13L]
MVKPADDWEVYNEQLVCVGSPNHVNGKNLSIVRSMPILNITSRPDILPTWLRAMSLTFADIKSGARYDHNYLALPAVMTGKCLLVAPEIVVSDLVRGAFCTLYRDQGLAAAYNIAPMRSTAVTILKSLGLFAGGSSDFAKRPPSSKPRDTA